MRKTKDVLVVDDDEPLRTMVCTALTAAELSCDTADNGVHAIKLLQTTDYSVVLLDLRMPQMGGEGVITKAAEWEPLQARQPVVLIMTAFPDRDALPNFADSVQAMIRKPFDITDLVAIVRGCVVGRR